MFCLCFFICLFLKTISVVATDGEWSGERAATAAAAGALSVAADVGVQWVPVVAGSVLRARTSASYMRVIVASWRSSVAARSASCAFTARHSSISACNTPRRAAPRSAAPRRLAALNTRQL